ncbi:MAG: hypothetical protein IKM20_08470 [Erysipelotrichales bacterium]|nr:hypothetical protein [Erysipelotrichales bacterium]
MSHKIERINTYDDERFDSNVLKEHGAFIVDDILCCSFRIKDNHSAIVAYDEGINVEEVIEEYRFYTEHITDFYDTAGKLLKQYETVETFDVALKDIQPSQFLVDADKVDAVMSFVNSGEDIIIPLIKSEDTLISADGHTRLFVANQKGITIVKGFYTEDNEYIHGFVKEARKRNVYSPLDLKWVPHDIYEIEWNTFCDNYFNQIKSGT